jgi:membrane protein implicated in regulation of membrane protease activity
MELWLIWVVAGFALVIAELVTGTFYLLMVGLGAFAAAGAAWLDLNLLAQAAIGSVVAVVGAILVHHWHAAQRKLGGSNLLDRGQPVVLEGWTNEAARIARVRYRGAFWDAKLARAEENPAPGSTLYIESQDGNTLIVAMAKPN